MNLHPRHGPTSSCSGVHRAMLAALVMLLLVVGACSDSREPRQPPPEPGTGQQQGEVSDGAQNGGSADDAGTNAARKQNADAHGDQANGSGAEQAPQEGDRHGPQKPVDPLKLNGPLFVGWPKPQVALVLSGQQEGYIEPCGCAGLENQKGGLKRRHTLVRSLAERGWPVVPLDLGGQIHRFSRQAEIKLQTTIQSLVKIGYQAVGFGPQDLRLPPEQLISIAANLEETPFVSANVGLLDFDAGFTSRSRIVEAGGRKIGVTAVLGKRFQAAINNDDVKLLPAEEALTPVLEKLKAEADFLVLLAFATSEESKALAEKFPELDVVVSAGGAEEPPAEAETLAGGKTRLVHVGAKGMYVVVLGLYDDVETPLRYQRVPLDARYADSADMQAIFTEYQNELKALGLPGLGLKPRPHPTGRTFVGSEACGDCHSAAYAVWEKTPHAHATQTLVDLKPPRHFDPECLACHVTGWDAREFVPYASGYLGLGETPRLTANGCENCHGPGSRHVAAESGEIDAGPEMLTALRNEMRLPYAQAERKCVECHDTDNSPEFSHKGFAHYWKQVEHHGKD